MKAVILAGGLGTRLSQETDLKPKPIVEIGGRPIIWHIMKIFSQHGINEFIVCCGYLGYFIQKLTDLSGAISFKLEGEPQLHEEQCLMLDSSRAKTILNWHSELDLISCLTWKMDWHHASTEQTDMTEFSVLADLGIKFLTFIPEFKEL